MKAAKKHSKDRDAAPRLSRKAYEAELLRLQVGTVLGGNSQTR